MAVQDTVSSLSSRQDDASLADWLRLARTPGISRLSANLLLAEYGSPQGVMAAASAFADAEPAAQPQAGEGAPRRIVVRDGDRVQMNAAAARLLNAPLGNEIRAELEAAAAWAAQD